ncbi:MAG TPA: hypothetical protein VF621_13505 [Pyrinomonadaceae bacterium]|jgi:hypothetical protein
MISASMICEMLCEMTTAVRSSLMASRLFLICSVATASRLAVGSSRKMMGGSLRKSAQGAQGPPRAVERRGLPPAEEEVDRHDGRGDQPDVQVGREHDGEREERAGEQRQDVYEGVLHELRQALGPAVDARLEDAGLVVRVGVEGEPVGEDAFDGGLRQAARHVDPNPLAEEVLPVPHARVDDLLAEQHGANEQQQRGALPVVGVRFRRP